MGSGQGLFLNAIAARKDERIQRQSNSIKGAVVIHDSAQVSKSALIGKNVRVCDSVIFGDVKISDGSYVNGSIIGWKSRLGRWTRLTNLCILGEDVEIKPEVALNGVTVCPHKGVKESYIDCPGKIIL